MAMATGCVLELSAPAASAENLLFAQLADAFEIGELGLTEQQRAPSAERRDRDVARAIPVERPLVHDSATETFQNAATDVNRGHRPGCSGGDGRVGRDPGQSDPHLGLAIGERRERGEQHGHRPSSIGDGARRTGHLGVNIGAPARIEREARPRAIEPRVGGAHPQRFPM